MIRGGSMYREARLRVFMASRQPEGTVSHPGRPSLNTITDDVQLTRFVLPLGDTSSFTAYI